MTFGWNLQKYFCTYNCARVFVCVWNGIKENDVKSLYDEREDWLPWLFINCPAFHSPVSHSQGRVEWPALSRQSNPILTWEVLTVNVCHVVISVRRSTAWKYKNKTGWPIFLKEEWHYTSYASDVGRHTFLPGSFSRHKFPEIDRELE